MRARKRFGQHFLEPAWARKVVDAIAPGAEDTFLEIGPGRGAITRPLAARAGRVVAIELDRDLAAALGSEHLGSLDVIQGDFLDVDLDAIGLPPLTRVAGNLPYNVSSPILIRLLDGARTPRRFRDASVMLQREVADRVLAEPGSRDYGPLAIFVAATARASRLLTLPPGAFRPMPAVTSSVVRLDFEAFTPLALPATFAPLVRGIFTMRRKMLVNALSATGLQAAGDSARILATAGIDGRRRPETLTLPELVALSAAADSQG
jgi:16S rRNA (adenine1518-N6/adenine1519-N6)-dimethyltransferase